jgi:hypothetical protein
MKSFLASIFISNSNHVTIDSKDISVKNKINPNQALTRIPGENSEDSLLDEIHEGLKILSIKGFKINEELIVHDKLLDIIENKINLSTDRLKTNTKTIKNIISS